MFSYYRMCSLTIEHVLLLLYVYMYMSRIFTAEGRNVKLMHMHIPLHVHLHTHIRIHIHKQIHIQIQIHVHIPIPIPTHIWIPPIAFHSEGRQNPDRGCITINVFSYNRMCSLTIECVLGALHSVDG